MTSHRERTNRLSSHSATWLIRARGQCSVWLGFHGAGEKPRRPCGLRVRDHLGIILKLDFGSSLLYLFLIYKAYIKYRLISTVTESKRHTLTVYARTTLAMMNNIVHGFHSCNARH